VVRLPYVGRLETVNDWRKQIAKIYREMRRGELPHEQGTRLTYVADIGARLAKVQEELKELQKLREQLARLEASTPGYQGVTALLPADRGDAVEVQP
jgi:hypothetical protein